MLKIIQHKKDIDMKQTRLLFIDRDGTLIQEPEDEQIDSFEKLVFTKGVMRNLSFIAQHTDYQLVMVSNQDGLGTDSFPENTFWPVHNFIIQTLESEGIHFKEQLIDRHFPEDNSPMRKPGTGMLTHYIDNPEYDLANSYVIGDRETDAQLAENLGCKSLILGKDGMDWDKIAEILFAGDRVAEVKRTTKETDIYIKVNLDGSGHCDIYTGRLKISALARGLRLAGLRLCRGSSKIELAIYADGEIRKELAGGLRSTRTNLLCRRQRHFIFHEVLSSSHDIRHFAVNAFQFHRVLSFLCSTLQHQRRYASTSLCRAMCNRPAFDNTE